MLADSYLSNWQGIATAIEAAMAKSTLQLELKVQHSLKFSSSDGWLEFSYSDKNWVKEESDEIAKEYEVPCAGCVRRIEVNGNNKDMELFNDFLLGIEAVQSLGDAIAFDTNSGTVL